MSIDFAKMQQVFLTAVERHRPEEWQAYLDQACGADDELRHQVGLLLQAHQQAGSVPGAAVSEPDQTGAYQAQTELPGTVIGPYKLLEQIGEGGMGTVWMAQQTEPVKRVVALKLIKPGMDSQQVLARFEAERQALAMMEHPNIAKVLDAGKTPTGRPYFAMELVKGVPITKYCDEHHLTARERLELFLPVCHAVQHAHQKGIIHRDLKPSNVLIAEYDDKPVSKVIDFGVAKAIGPKLTDRTMFTGLGQIVGTLEYMSPEQAKVNALDIDTRSDIYSLGVLLYELLTGSTPIEKKRLREAELDEMLRIIREEEPPKPSKRISKLGQAATMLSIQRKSDPKHLSQLIRGELDWIVMKALDKDRNRRYETASALGCDIERYLHDEAVQAFPPSAGYRVRKFARRYRTLLRIAGAFVILLVLAAAVSTWQAVRATRERDRAEASFRMARDAVDRLFTQVSQSPKLKMQGMEKFRKELLQNAKEFYDRFIREQFDAQAVRYDLGLAYHRLGEIDRELGDYAAAEQSLNQAVAILGEVGPQAAGSGGVPRDLAASYAALGLVYLDTARWEKADAAYQQALAIQEKQTAANPETPEYRHVLAKTYCALGLVHYRAEHFESASTRYQQALDILKLVKDDPLSEHESLMAATQMNLGQLYFTRASYKEAETALKEAQSIYERLVRGPKDVLPEYWQSLGRSHAILGMVYERQTHWEKAEAAQQQGLQMFEKLAKEHPDVPEYVYDVGRCFGALADTAGHRGQLEAALVRDDKAIEILEGVTGRGYLAAQTMLLNARINRAIVLAARGDHAQATGEAAAVARQGDLLVSHLYNVACVFSRSSAGADRDTKLPAADRARLKACYADRAMDFLGQAVAKGFRVPRRIREDPDLEPLRAREDLQKLLLDLEAKEKE